MERLAFIHDTIRSIESQRIIKRRYTDDVVTAGNADLNTERIPESARESLANARIQQGSDYAQWTRPRGGYARNDREYIHYLNGRPYVERRHGQVAGNALWYEPDYSIQDRPEYMVTRTEEPLHKHIQGADMAGTWGI